MFGTEQQEAPAQDLRMRPLSWLRAIEKQKFWLLAVWAIGTALAILVVHALPLVYKSGTLVLVEGQRIPRDFVSPTVDTGLAEQLGALREQVLSYSRLLLIVNKYGLYGNKRNGAAEEQIIQKMREDVTVELEKSGSHEQLNAFRISYTGTKPAIVAAVANELTDQFVQENLRLRESQANGTADFLQAQKNEAKQRLEQQEALLSVYKLKHSGQLPQQETALLTKLNQLQAQLQGAQDRASRAQQDKILVESSLKSAQDSLATLTSIASGKSEISGVSPDFSVAKLQARLEELQQVYTDDHPEVIRVRSLLAAARAREAEAAKLATHSADLIARSQATLPPDVVQALASQRERIAQFRAEIAVLDKQVIDSDAERQALLAQIAATQAMVDQLPAREQEMASLMRDYQISKENYQSLLDKKLAADMAGDMERRQKSERFVILERARIPEVPVKPKRPILYGAGSFVAFILAATLAGFLERRRNVFLGEWELPSDVPVLARLPVIDMNQTEQVFRP